MSVKIQIYKMIIKISPAVAYMTSWIKYANEYERSLESLYRFYHPKKISFHELPETKEQKDISLIVPIYNSKSFLERCIESLVNQKTKYAYEILLIDNGSTDGSAEMAQAYAKKYEFVRMYRQERPGAAAARNMGIEHAVGTYLGFVDSDDYIADSYVEHLLERAYQTGADVVKCGHYRWDEEKQKILYTVQYEERSYCGDIGSDILNFKGLACEGISKRALWINYRFPEGYWYEDMIMRFVLFRQAEKIEILGETLYYYVQHEENAPRRRSENEQIKCLDELYLLQALMQLPLQQKEKALCHALIYELGAMLWSRTRRLKNKIKKEVFNSGRQLLEQHLLVDEEYSFEEQRMINAYRNHSYISWQILSCRQMLRTKIANREE